MPPIKLPDGSYKCPICQKGYKLILKADQCENSHHSVIIRTSKKEVKDLVSFLFTGDEKWKPEALMRQFMKIASQPEEIEHVDLPDLQEGDFSEPE